MRPHSRAMLLAALLGLALIPQAPALAADKQWTLCEGDDDDAAITACTQIIARGSKETKNNQAIAYYNRGVSYRNKGNDEKAMADYEVALGLNPKYASAYNGRANILSDRGQFNDAIEDYNRALKFEPKNSSFLRNRALTFVKQGAFSAAMADYDRAIGITKTNHLLFYNRGQLYEKQGLTASALADYRKSVSVKPDFQDGLDAVKRLAAGGANPPPAAQQNADNAADPDWDACAGNDDDKSIVGCTAVLARGDRENKGTQAAAYYNRGVSYRNKGDNEKALADYAEALRLRPAYGAALNGRANIRTDQGDTVGALADYTEAIRLEPNDASYLRNRALTYVKIGNLASAMDDYTKGISLNSKNHLLFYNRGELYEKLGDKARAIADYRASASVKPDFVDAQDALKRLNAAAAAGSGTPVANDAAATSAQGQDKAWNDCASADAATSIAGCTEVIGRGASETVENQALAYRNRAVSKYNQLNYVDALADLNESIRLAPAVAAAWETRGDTYSWLKQCDRAVADYGKAIELDPKSIAAYLGRSSCRLNAKDYDGAIADANEALTLDPKGAGANIALANVYTQRNEFERAVRSLDTAIALQPDRADLLVHRGNINLFRGKLDDAFRDYDKAAGVDAKSVDAYNGRGIVANFRGEQETAIADFSKAIDLDPATSMYYTNRAEVLMDMGQTAQAKPDLAKAIEVADAILAKTPKTDPTGFSTLLDRAYAKVLDGQLDDGIADANDALAIDPRSKEALDTRGLAFAGKKDFPRAISDLSQGIAIGGYVTQIYRHRAETYEAMGSYDLAIDDYKAVLRLAPGHAMARAGLVRTQQALASGATAATLLSPVNQGGQPQKPATPVVLGTRVALIIGNGNYQRFGTLPNPKRDAERLAATLKQVGFTKVTIAEDLSNSAFNDSLRSFARDADGADWAVIYYAGHGIEIANTNYLIPVDAQLASDRDVQFEAVPLERVLSAVDGAKGMKLVILDACRENPFATAMKRSVATRAVTRGLARVEPDGATIVAYAAKAGQVAQDGTGANSPFVTALTTRIQTPGIEIGKLFRLVRDDVMTATGRQQEPFTYGSLPSDDMFINPSR